MSYENTIAILIAIRKYADKTEDIDEIAEQFAKLIREYEKK